MRRAQGDTLEAKCYRTVRQVARECADEIERRYPKVLRRVGGYNLDEFVDESKPFNLAKIIVGSEGTLGMIVGGEGQPGAAAEARRRCSPIEFEQLLDALAATPAILKHKPSAIEVMDGFILDHARENPAMDRDAPRDSADRRSGRAPVRRALRATARTTCRRASRRSSATWRRSACVHRRLRWRAGSGAHLELPRGVARPVDGDEGRRQVALVRRGHGRRAREAARLHRRVPRDDSRATARPPASTRTPRSAACTSGRS